MNVSATKATRTRLSKVARTPKGRLSFSWWRAARISSQGFFLLIFVYLFLSTTVNVSSPLPVDLFLRLDPLLGIGASLATREATPNLIWTVPLMGGTLLLGRFFCGWVCPLGTTLDLARLRRSEGLAKATDESLRRGKYLVLVVLLLAAALGNLTLLAFDPLSLFTRTWAALVFPALDHAFAGAVDLALALGVPLTTMLDLISLVRGTILPINPGYYAFAPVLLLVFSVVVGVNAVAHRFWCRYLCPLAALLAFLGRWSLFRRQAEACIGCRRCLEGCRMGAIEGKGGETAAGECVLCLQCLETCPQRAVSFGRRGKSIGYDPSRRQLLLATGIGVAGLATMAVSPANASANPYLIRPPGADASDFLSRCARCGQCVKVCPSGGLQPALFEAGLAGLWSPILVPRLGPCEYPCNVCGQVCPTAAIPLLELAQKQQIKLGTAYIDRSRCIPWADNIPCNVCQEVCQVPTKAIKGDVVLVKDASGEQIELMRPVVLRQDCIGCGVCEHNCPLPGPAAIRVMTEHKVI